MQNNTGNGFISVDEAIQMIEASSKDHPVVDSLFLLQNLEYLQVNNNYNIRLVAKNEQGKNVRNGSKYVRIESDWDKSRLEHAIVEHYKELTGKEIDPKQIGIKNRTNTIDDKTNPRGVFKADTKPMTKFGDETYGGERVVEE